MFQYSCHRRRNVFTSNGSLVLQATVNPQQRSSRFAFNSAKLISLKSFQYGRIEVRAKLPEGHLLRPSILLKPVSYKYSGDWLDNGQINLMVYSQQPGSIVGGLHYKMANGHSYVGRKFRSGANLTQEFHRFTVEWTNETLRFLFDDQVYFEHQVASPFDQKFYLTIQLGVGGPEFDSKTNNNNISPANGKEIASRWKNNKFIVDWVKMWREVNSKPDDLEEDEKEGVPGEPEVEGSSGSTQSKNGGPFDYRSVRHNACILIGVSLFWMAITWTLQN